MVKWRAISTLSLLQLKVEETIMERQYKKEFRGQYIQCPESQAKEISFLFIFNKEPLKDFEQEIFSELCLRKIYLAATIR